MLKPIKFYFLQIELIKSIKSRKLHFVSSEQDKENVKIYYP